MNKKWLLPVCMIISISFLFNACGNKASRCTPEVKTEAEQPVSVDKDEAETIEEAKENEEQKVVEAAEGFEILGGSWGVGAIYDPEKRILVDIYDNKLLLDSYLSEFLYFSEDGSFSYTNHFVYKGIYQKYDVADNSYDRYLLKTEKKMKFDVERCEFVEIESNSTKASYLLTVLDENTIRFCEMDPFTGKEKADNMPLLFVRQYEVSDYIKENKTEITSGKRPSENSSNNTNGSSRNTAQEETSD